MASDTTDLTQAEFDAECQRRGFVQEFIDCYYLPGTMTHVSIGHCETRREALLHLMEEQRKLTKDMSPQK